MGEKISIIILLFLAICITISKASRDVSTLPHIDKSFNTKPIDDQVGVRSCSYKVVITTSCSSVKYTRDHISLSFGDAYDNEVYAPRIDDPNSKTFERCSEDTFEINGPCMYDDICYLYLYRTGSDGWKPDTVTVYTSRYNSVTFKFNRFVPRGVWYGFNRCDHLKLPTSSTAA